MKTLMRWNEKLKQARKDAHLTQQEVADYMGVSRSTVANWEISRRKPNFIELNKLANKLRVDVNYLVEGEEIQPERDLITRATSVFTDDMISTEDKDAIFQDIMEVYLKGKQKNGNKRTETDRKTK